MAARTRKQTSVADVRADLAARLDARRDEIEEATLTRVNAVVDSDVEMDSVYLEGLKTAVTAAVDYGVEGIRRGDERPPPIPVPLVAQARISARHGVDLSTVLRRYFAGYTVLGHFVVEEAEVAGTRSDALREVLRTQALRFDHLVALVTEEYGREMSGQGTSTAQRRTELIKRLLEGEWLDAGELAYDFTGCHLGLVGSGEGAADAVRDLAARFDCRLLLLPSADQVVWAWLGSRRPLDLERFEEKVFALPEHVAMSCGVPGVGVPGWRLTHRQAMAVLPVARTKPGRLVAYAEFALLAGAIQNDLLATSLRGMYLAPLGLEQDRGPVLRETLRAYFSHGRNASSTAAALGISRNTVSSRLATVEEMIGRPLLECGVELEVALKLDELHPDELP